MNQKNFKKYLQIILLKLSREVFTKECKDHTDLLKTF